MDDNCFGHSFHVTINYVNTSTCPIQFEYGEALSENGFTIPAEAGPGELCEQPNVHILPGLSRHNIYDGGRCGKGELITPLYPIVLLFLEFFKFKFKTWCMH